MHICMSTNNSCKSYNQVLYLHTAIVNSAKKRPRAREQSGGDGGVDEPPTKRQKTEGL